MTVVGECSLMPATIEPGQCHWCTAPLPKRRKRWCSDECGHQYWAQHNWAAARDLRVRIDHRICQACGVLTIDWTNEKRHPDFPQPPEYPEWVQDESDAERRMRANARYVLHTEYLREVQAWRKKMQPLLPEVNHVNPRVGKGYAFGCWNHVTELETLCHRCHVKVTTRQRRERRAERAAQFQAALEMGPM